MKELEQSIQLTEGTSEEKELPARNCVKQPCGAVLMEVMHPEHGWIPFNATGNGGGLSSLMYNLAHMGAFGDFVEEDPLTEEELAGFARAERDGLLLELDAFVASPLRWASLTQVQQDELSAYRIALLDVPQQEEFPSNITWAERPAFLPD